MSYLCYLYLLCRGFMSYLCYLYLFTYTGVKRDFHIRLCLCSLTVTCSVLLKEQEMLTGPQHLGTPSDSVRFMLHNL